MGGWGAAAAPAAGFSSGGRQVFGRSAARAVGAHASHEPPAQRHSAGPVLPFRVTFVASSPTTLSPLRSWAQCPTYTCWQYCMRSLSRPAPLPCLLQLGSVPDVHVLAGLEALPYFARLQVDEHPLLKGVSWQGGSGVSVKVTDTRGQA